MKYLATFLCCLTLLGQEFIPYFQTAAPSNNQLLGELRWYVKFDTASGDELIYKKYGFPGDAIGRADHTTDFGTAAGVINTARTQSAGGGFLGDIDTQNGTGTTSLTFTITGWIKLTSVAADQVILSSWDTGNTIGEWRLIFKNAATKVFQLQVRKGDNSSFTLINAQPSAPITTGVWYFISFGYDESIKTASILAEADGAGVLPNKVTGAIVGGMAPVFMSLVFGADRNASSLDATGIDATVGLNLGSAFDEWGDWDVILTPNQLLKLYLKTPFSSFTL